MVLGRVLIAPGDAHMQIKKIGMEYIVECVKGENVNGHFPSIGVIEEQASLSNIPSLVMRWLS